MFVPRLRNVECVLTVFVRPKFEKYFECGLSKSKSIFISPR